MAAGSEKIRWIITANGGLIVDNQTGETLVSNTLPAARGQSVIDKGGTDESALELFD